VKKFGFEVVASAQQIRWHVARETTAITRHEASTKQRVTHGLSVALRTTGPTPGKHHLSRDVISRAIRSCRSKCGQRAVKVYEHQHVKQSLARTAERDAHGALPAGGGTFKSSRRPKV